MAKYTIYQDTTLEASIAFDYVNQGWTVVNGVAYHETCNAGIIKTTIDLSGQTSWTFRYEVVDVDSNGVNIRVDGQNGVNRIAAGVYEDTFTVTGANKEVAFYATGVAALKLLQVYSPALNFDGLTLMFNEDANRWVTYYSYIPEFMLKFITEFFTFKDGELWQHNINDTRNNFYGEQYSSNVIFVCNDQYQKNKIFTAIRLDSKGAWYSPSLTTNKTDQFPNGMASRLKKANLKNIDGKLWADLLNDMNDPNFNNITPDSTRQLQALFKGRKLQGGWMVIALQNDDTTEARLSSAEVYYFEAERNF